MPVYFDHNATSPLDERVKAQMIPFFSEGCGNPSSAHQFGRKARRALDEARERVAALVRVDPSRVIFTSGGTESNNLALAGCARALAGGRIAVSAIEHPSVLETAKSIAGSAWTVDKIESNRHCLITPEALEKVLTKDTRIVSVMMANNETGALQPIRELAARAKQSGAIVHCDAVQAAGKVSIDMTALGVQLMSLSAHKFGGPQGVGALIIDRSIEMMPLMHGGGQESGFRSGSENVAAIVGFGVAAELALTELEIRRSELLELRVRLENGLRTLAGTGIHAETTERLPNTVMFELPNIESETLLMLLDRSGFAVSSSSACGAARMEPSHVLRAMGLDLNTARSSIRVSLGMGNTADDVDAFLRQLSTLSAAPLSAAAHA